MTDEAFTSKLTQRSQGIKDLEEELQVLYFEEYWDEYDDTIVIPHMKFMLMKLKDAIITQA